MEFSKVVKEIRLKQEQQEVVDHGGDFDEQAGSGPSPVAARPEVVAHASSASGSASAASSASAGAAFPGNTHTATTTSGDHVDVPAVPNIMKTTSNKRRSEAVAAVSASRPDSSPFQVPQQVPGSSSALHSASSSLPVIPAPNTTKNQTTSLSQHQQRQNSKPLAAVAGPASSATSNITNAQEHQQQQHVAHTSKRKKELTYVKTGGGFMIQDGDEGGVCIANTSGSGREQLVMLNLKQTKICVA